MKKLLILSAAFMMAVGLSACATKNDGQSSTAVKKETTASQANLKRPMVQFYYALAKTINAKDADLNAYEAKENPTPEMKAPASKSAAAVVEALKTVQIPAELKGHKAEIEAVLKDISDSYQAKADELKKDVPSLDAANAKFTQGEDKIGNVFVEVKLGKPSLNKEVNG